MERGASNAERPQRDYQVFLSFRGCDTRRGFTDSLYHSLVDARVRVFLDNKGLRPGDRIREILAAINKSQVCIPIFSENYAKSKWCLMELAEMVKLKKVIMPIFYDVKAEDVKLKTDLYRNQLCNFREKHGAKKVEWEKALEQVGASFDTTLLERNFTDAGQIKAWDITQYSGDGQLCKEVVKEILIKLEVRHKIVDGSLIGIDHHVDAMMNLLDVRSSDVRFTVIHGMGGVGKTTLAKVIFNKLCNRDGGFDCCCFLDDVRETTNSHGIIYLQNKLLKQLSRGTKEIDNNDSGINSIKDFVKNKKVLIILDDLDQHKQIKSLAGDSTWFYSGSRIIITTKNLSCVVKQVKVQDNVKICEYNISKMSPGHALQLFSTHAFKQESPPAEHLDISKEIVTACGQLPLALEVMGSYLFHTNKELWKSHIHKIASREGIHDKLMISYKALDQRAKEIFLDIACFFVGSETKYAKYMWEACDFRPDEGIECLSSMSLVKISKDNTFWMHDLLRDLGREIVIREKLRCPEKRSRLWLPNEVERILWRGKATTKTYGLRVTRNSDSDGGILGNIVSANQIIPLQNLTFLELDRVHLEGDFKNALQDLKWFSWKNMGDSRVTNLVLKDLVVLELSNDDLSDEWLSTIEIGENLKVLKLAYTSAPIYDRPMGFTKFQEILKNSSSLAELEISSPQLREVPDSIGNIKNLRVMKLTNSSISVLPGSIGDLEKLEELHITESSTLEYIPEEIGRLRQLKILNLSDSTNIKQLPSTVCELPLLQHLDLEGCDCIQELPKLPLSLTVLRVKSRSLRKLPNLSNLERLTVLFVYGDVFKPTLLEHHLTRYNPDWINNCPLLESLQLGSTGIISLEMESCAFPSLKKLELICSDLKDVEQLPLSLTSLKLRANTAGNRLSTCLGEMEALNDLELFHTKFVGELPLPRNLKTLHILSCHFPQPSLDLSGLKILRYLKVRSCEKLTAIRGIENMECLEEIIVDNCPSLTEVSDLSKFERLSIRSDNPALFEGIGGINVTTI